VSEIIDGLNQTAFWLGWIALVSCSLLILFGVFGFIADNLSWILRLGRCTTVKIRKVPGAGTDAPLRQTRPTMRTSTPPSLAKGNYTLAGAAVTNGTTAPPDYFDERRQIEAAQFEEAFFETRFGEEGLVH